MRLQLLPKEENVAHTVTAVKLSSNVDSTSFVSSVRSMGVLIARGLIKEVNYFRVGHMGSVNANDIIATVVAIERALYKHGCEFKFSEGLARTQYCSNTVFN